LVLIHCCSIDEHWKKISKGIPSGRKSANDRAPTLEELRKLSEYPDRRIRPIVCLMASSGIRLGSFDTLNIKEELVNLRFDCLFINVKRFKFYFKMYTKMPNKK
jgi:hypothetical protein